MPELACTKPLCDNYRWLKKSHLVGSSAHRISPRFYLAVGISGQPQHMMGVRGAKTIIAINSDPEAPIFGKCTYGIVGDAQLYCACADSRAVGWREKL